MKLLFYAPNHYPDRMYYHCSWFDSAECDLSFDYRCEVRPLLNAEGANIPHWLGKPCLGAKSPDWQIDSLRIHQKASGSFWIRVKRYSVFSPVSTSVTSITQSPSSKGRNTCPTWYFGPISPKLLMTPLGTIGRVGVVNISNPDQNTFSITSICEYMSLLDWKQAKKAETPLEIIMVSRGYDLVSQTCQTDSLIAFCPDERSPSRHSLFEKR